nr:Dihydrofolate reductase incomplete domain containing protein [Pandoravirus aubagnensis]
MERPQSSEPLVGRATTPVDVRIVAAVDSDHVIAFEGDDDLPWEFGASGQLERIARKVASYTVVVGGPAAPRLRALFCKSRVVVMGARATLHREVPVIETVDDALAQCAPGQRLYVTGNSATLEIFLPYATRADLYALDVPLVRQDDSGAARNEPERFPSIPTSPLLVVVEPNATELHVGLPFRRISHELDPIACAFLGASVAAPPVSESFDGGKIVRAAQRGVLLNKTINNVRALTAHEAEEEDAAMVEMAMIQSFYETGRGARAPANDPDWDESWCDGEEESDFDDIDADADDPDAKQDSAH